MAKRKKDNGSNHFWTLVFGVIVVSVGFFSLAAGFSQQFGGNNDPATILPYYLLGIALVMSGKHLVHSTGMGCCNTR